MLSGYRNPDAMGVDEVYASAIQTSNLRLETREGAPQRAADVVIAAGWNKARLGGALIELQSKFDRSERPRQVVASELLLRGLVQEAASRAKDGKLGQHEKAQLKAQAQRLAAAENYDRTSIFLGRLRQFPAVRDQLALQLGKWGAHDPLTKATQVLRWWLENKCTACKGRRWLTIEGTGRLSNKACPACRATSERTLPYGDEGKRILCHIERSLAAWTGNSNRSLHR